MKQGKVSKVKVSKEMQRNWGWLMALGILFLLAGAISMGMVVAVTLVSMFFIGILVLIGGVGQLVDAFKSQGWKAIVWHVLIGLLYILAGIIIIYDPFVASSILTALIAWILIVIGVARVLMAFTLKEGEGWYWFLLAGIASVILGFMILLHWPATGLWVIGLLISIELLVCGWTTLFVAIALRQSGKVGV